MEVIEIHKIKAYKVCSMCKVEKPRSAYHTHSKLYKRKGEQLIRAIYLNPKCKDCRNKIGRTDKHREYKKLSRRQRTVEKPEVAARNYKKWFLKNKHKAAAHQRVFQAVKKGLIKRTSCLVCGKQNPVHAHHPDYSKPLTVVYLCPPHHWEAHHKQ